MNLVSRIGQLLGGRRPPPHAAGTPVDGEPGRAEVKKEVERIAALSPHLRMARRYASRLEPPVATALRYVTGLVDAIPPAREASAAAWAHDPYIRTFFASADAVVPALSRSGELAAFFAQNPEEPEAYAVIGMAMLEKRVLGAALEGGTMRRDVVQETISFSDHQVRMCGRSESALRKQIMRRLVAQLGLQGLARYAAQETQRGQLESERALLRTRLRLLERKGVGVAALVGGGDAGDADAGELARLQEAITENEAAIAQLGLRSESLDRELDEVCAVLAEPGAHLTVNTRLCVLNRMNVVLPPDSAETGDELLFHVAQLPTVPPRMRAFALVRIDRESLHSQAGLLDQAARMLGGMSAM